MSLFDAAYETYEAAEEKARATYENLMDRVGVFEEGIEPLFPIYHWGYNADIEVTLSSRGEFRGCRDLKDDEENRLTIAPDTVDSANRTSKGVPHALCDKLEYLDPCGKEKYKEYMANLGKWVDSEFSHPKIRAVYEYLKKETLRSDLEKADLGNVVTDKAFIRWIVHTKDKSPDECWRDTTLFDSWIKYYRSVLEKTYPCIVSNISGKLEPKCLAQRKNVVNFSANAKLISANDNENFTYRGRFIDKDECLAIGYDTSQKIHAALRYCFNNFKVIVSGRAFACWATNNKPVPRFFDDKGIDNELTDLSGSDQDSSSCNYRQYEEKLYKSLYGKENYLNEEDNVVIASLEAPVKGRLSITYFTEITGSQFLENISKWYMSLCMPYFSRGKSAVRSPTLQTMIKFAFGTERDEKFVVDEEKLKRNMMQSLVQCVVEGRSMPLEIVSAIWEKAKSLYAFSEFNRKQLLFVATSVIRKFINDKHEKEVYGVNLDRTNRNTSYLFGRLLAIADWAERSTFQSKDEHKETNALRLFEYFTRSPMKAWMILEGQLHPYFASMPYARKVFFKNLIGEVVSLLPSNDGNELNKPLKPEYLLGYYQQLNDLRYNPDKKEVKECKEDE